jgi:hypothetical protein
MVELMLADEIEWTILSDVMWLNVVAEKSKLMIISGFHLYRLYKWMSVPRRTYVIHFAI